jgi:dynein heavy chain
LINSSILGSLTGLVKHIIMSALKSQETWGVLPRHKDESVKGFVKVLEGFVTDLDVAMVNLDDSVQLNSLGVDLSQFKKPSEYVNAMHSPEIVNDLESMFPISYL